ncbi:MAG: hypothetical protein ABIG96_04575 [Candidatus Micrarchaeota archaeon]
MPRKPEGAKLSYVDAFINPFKLQLQQPKILLIGMLNWIPLLLMAFFLSGLVSRYMPIMKQFSSAGKPADPKEFAVLLPKLFKVFLDYLPQLILLGIIAFVLYNIMLLAFTHIVIQKYRSKNSNEPKISLSEAFNVALGKVLTLIAATLWMLLVMLLIIIAAILLITFGAFLGPFVIIVALLVGIGLIFSFLILGFAGMILEIVLLTENKGGRQTAVNAITFAWKNKFQASLLVIGYFLAFVILGSVADMFEAIPVAGTIIGMLLGLPITAWSAMAQAEIYYAMRSR